MECSVSERCMPAKNKEILRGSTNSNWFEAVRLLSHPDELEDVNNKDYVSEFLSSSRLIFDECSESTLKFTNYLRTNDSGFRCVLVADSMGQATSEKSINNDLLDRRVIPSEKKTRQSGSETNHDPTDSNVRQSTTNSSTEQQSIVVRGIYIGMSENLAIKQLKEIFGSDLETSIKQHPSNESLDVCYYSSPSLLIKSSDRSMEGMDCLVNIDKSTRHVYAFSVCGKHFEKMFQAADVGFNDFAQQFMSKYHIKEFAPDRKQSNNRLRVFTHTQGSVKITICDYGENTSFLGFCLDRVNQAKF